MYHFDLEDFEFDLIHSRAEMDKILYAAIKVENARLRAIATTQGSYRRWVEEGISDYLGYKEPKR
mgnify:CR=1 FL=1